MFISYPNKKSEQEILEFNGEKIVCPAWNKETNKLLYGENLFVLKLLLYEYNLRNKIDLIYIDPPFATNTVFKTDESRSSSISMPLSGDVAYSDTLSGDNFMEFLRERLIIARELLSDKGSIYLHIDYKTGHYVKILMDEIFGQENFRNDITRIKCNPKNFNRKAYGNIKDLILFYTKSKNPVWNNPYYEYTEEDICRLYKKRDKNGRFYTTVPLHAPGETQNGATCQPFKGILPPKGRHWRCSPEELEELDKNGLIEWSENNNPRKIIYADEQPGKKIQDIWEFKDPQYPVYPTEKNLEMLKQIIKTSSDSGSIILDFFCGSGTTLVAAEELSRKWIGIDQSPKAIEAARKRLAQCKNLFSQGYDFIDIGEFGNNPQYLAAGL